MGVAGGHLEASSPQLLSVKALFPETYGLDQGHPSGELSHHRCLPRAVDSSRLSPAQPFECEGQEVMGVVAVGTVPVGVPGGPRVYSQGPAGQAAGTARLIASPGKGEDHLQLTHSVNLHQGGPQLPLVSAWQEPLGIRGDGENVPEP